MTEIVFFLIISAGGILGAAKLNKKYEELFPISCMGIVLVLFLSGSAGILEAGVYIVMIGAVLLWLYSLLWTVKHKSWKEFTDNVFTPGLFLIIVFYLALIFLNRGKLAAETDEFSHWIDCVKEMIYLNDFVTNPASDSMFMSYPPSMALFQYFYQKIFMIINPAASFSEWRCFLAFQIFSFSLFTPFFSGLSRKRPFEMCVYFFTVIVMPVFYFACYSNILIDPFLGMLIGAGISHIFLMAKKDIFYDIYMIMLLPVLALAKDAGQYFAAFLGVFFAYDHLNSKKIQGKITIRNIITAVLPFCAFAAARLVWKLELLSSDAMVSFGGKVDLIRYGKLIITGGGEGFEKISISSFIDAFFEKRLGISALDMQVNYFILFFLNMFLMYAAYKLLEKHEPEKKKTRLVIIWGTAVQTILYVYSLGATYISNFTQQEAAELAGYNRYMNIGFLPLWIIVLMSFLYYLSVYQNSSRFLLAALALVLILVSPMESVIHFMMKKPVRYSVSYREQYNEISNKIMESCEDNSRIAYINQNTESDDSFLIVRYNVRPEHLLNYEYKLEKDSEGNVKTTASQMKDILAENYDYAAIYMINDDFINDYGELFENPEDIAENAVYSVDRETGLLSRTI